MMANPFSEEEKRFVLAEAIKTSNVPIDRILNFLIDGGVSPAWSEMLLPHGRNLKSCIDAFDALRSNPPASYPALIPISPAPTASSKRKSAPEAFDPFAPSSSSKRRQSGSDTIITARSIQPKPASNGSPQFSSFATAPQPKKRGRPSKADVEARNAEAIARGEVLPTLRGRGSGGNMQIEFPGSTTLPPREVMPSPRMLAPSPIGGEFSIAQSPGQIAAFAPMMVGGPASEPSINPEERQSVESEGTAASGKKKRARPSSKAIKTSESGESSFQTVNQPPHFGHSTLEPAPPTPKHPDEGPATLIQAQTESQQLPPMSYAPPNAQAPEQGPSQRSNI